MILNGSVVLISVSDKDKVRSYIKHKKSSYPYITKSNHGIFIGSYNKQ